MEERARLLRHSRLGYNRRLPVTMVIRRSFYQNSERKLHAPGETRTRKPEGQQIFVPLWLSPPFPFVVWTFPSPLHYCSQVGAVKSLHLPAIAGLARDWQ
jgi:hypothetical protein